MSIKFKSFLKKLESATKEVENSPVKEVSPEDEKGWLTVNSPANAKPKERLCHEVSIKANGAYLEKLVWARFESINKLNIIKNFVCGRICDPGWRDVPDDDRAWVEFFNLPLVFNQEDTIRIVYKRDIKSFNCPLESKDNLLTNPTMWKMNEFVWDAASMDNLYHLLKKKNYAVEIHGEMKKTCEEYLRLALENYATHSQTDAEMDENENNQSVNEDMNNVVNRRQQDIQDTWDDLSPSNIGTSTTTTTTTTTTTSQTKTETQIGDDNLMITPTYKKDNDNNNNDDNNELNEQNVSSSSSSTTTALTPTIVKQKMTPIIGRTIKKNKFEDLFLCKGDYISQTHHIESIEYNVAHQRIEMLLDNNSQYPLDTDYISKLKLKPKSLSGPDPSSTSSLSTGYPDPSTTSTSSSSLPSTGYYSLEENVHITDMFYHFILIPDTIKEKNRIDYMNKIKLKQDKIELKKQNKALSLSSSSIKKKKASKRSIDDSNDKDADSDIQSMNSSSNNDDDNTYISENKSRKESNSVKKKQKKSYLQLSSIMSPTSLSPILEDHYHNDNKDDDEKDDDDMEKDAVMDSDINNTSIISGTDKMTTTAYMKQEDLLKYHIWNNVKLRLQDPFIKALFMDKSKDMTVDRTVDSHNVGSNKSGILNSTVINDKQNTDIPSSYPIMDSNSVTTINDQSVTPNITTTPTPTSTPTKAMLGIYRLLTNEIQKDLSKQSYNDIFINNLDTSYYTLSDIKHSFEVVLGISLDTNQYSIKNKTSIIMYLSDLFIQKYSTEGGGWGYMNTFVFNKEQETIEVAVEED